MADALIRQDLEPLLQQLFERTFPAYDTLRSRGSAFAQEQYDRSKEYLMEDNMRNIVTLILAGLARANGGQVAIGQADLGEVGDRIHLEADSVTGLITITLLPDYVKVGIDPELEVKPKTQYSIGWDPAITSNTTTANTITYKTTGPLTVGSGSMAEFTVPSGQAATYKVSINGIEQPGTFSGANFQYDEIK